MSVLFILTNTKQRVPPQEGDSHWHGQASPLKAALLDTDQEHSEVQREGVMAEKPTAHTGQ